MRLPRKDSMSMFDLIKMLAEAKVKFVLVGGLDTVAAVLDILVRPVIPFADLRRDAMMIEVGAISVPVASIEHLIAMKTGTGRSKDMIDIEELKKIQAQK